MKTKNQIRALLLSVLIFSAGSLNSTDKISAQDAVNFKIVTSTRIDNRIQEIPPVLLNYLADLDKAENYKNYTATAAEKERFYSYFQLMPKLFQNTANEKVIGVYFVKNFRTAGMTHYVFSEKEGLFLALIFNPEILTTGMDKWLAYRDISAAAEDPQLRVEVSMQSEYAVLLYTLVHELSHVVDIYYKTQMFPWPDLQYEKYKSILPADDVWQSFYVPKKRYDFPHRKKIRPYGLGLRLTSKELISIYEALPKYPYVSAYAAMSSGEDFAETFAVCYLKEYHNLEYRVQVSYSGKNKAVFAPLENPKVRDRCKNVLHLAD
jgi:hypothetical protein